MAKNYYIDTAILEHHWFNWIVSNSVPALEPYRKCGLVWTKIIGRVLDDKGEILYKGKQKSDFPDPSYQIREHCIALEKKLFFQSKGGEIEKKLPLALTLRQQVLN